jgi:hypothetical protein
MAELSPAALAVVEACWRARDAALDEDDMLGLAAALRAAADQVVPVRLETELHDRNPSLTLQKAVEIRQHLLAIAAELEGDGPAVSANREPASVVIDANPR